MKIMAFLMTMLLMVSLHASVPTEEGLLRNLNNADIPGDFIIVKAMIKSTTPSLAAPSSGVNEAESGVKADFYKFIISKENANNISLFQIAYSSSQMLNSQIRDVKYIPNLLSAIKKEKSYEKSLFYGIYMMLTTNQPEGMEAFLEKSGVQVVKNKNVLNEEKMKLLKAYRVYLANNRGKSDLVSPLNPTDPQNKARVLELFRSNTFTRAKNVELVKLENEFAWKIDWKNAVGYFTNEERRFRMAEYNTGVGIVKIEASDYVLFNGVNELPKIMTIKDLKGNITSIQVISLDIKKNIDKKLTEQYEEAKKSILPDAVETNYSFLF
jgi:hypothetical protein